MLKDLNDDQLLLAELMSRILLKQTQP